MEHAETSSMDDPSFWQSLGATEPVALVMSVVCLGLMAAIGLQSRDQRREERAWHEVHALVLKLSDMPRAMADVKETLSDLETRQAAMAADIEWLKRQKS